MNYSRTGPWGAPGASPAPTRQWTRGAHCSSKSGVLAPAPLTEAFAKIAKTDFSPKRPTFGKLELMKAQFTYWKEQDGRYLGYLNAYPDHWTQGENLEDLKEQLKDLYHTFSSDEIPGIRRGR